MREGSAFEDVALLESIREIVGTVDRLQGELWCGGSSVATCEPTAVLTEEVGSLLGTLVQHGFSGEASRLQAGFGGLVDCVRQGTASVWQPTASDAHTLQVSTSTLLIGLWRISVIYVLIRKLQALAQLRIVL